MKLLFVLLCALFITGCQSADPLSAKSDPKSGWWELAFIEPDYMKVWVENSSVWISWMGEPAILSFLSDITERKAAEAELESYRVHLEELVEERTEKLNAVNALLQEDIQMRKQTELELRSSEEKFREVFNNSREAILLIRP